MPSTEAKLLSDFLVAPASLRDFMTLRQFTNIFPKGHRSNPAVKELYRELYALRERDIEAVRQDIALEVKRSKQLRRDYARERRQVDEANVAGLDPVALQMEEEVRRLSRFVGRVLTLASSRVLTARSRTRSRPSMPALKKPAKFLKHKLPRLSKRIARPCLRSRTPSVHSVTYEKGAFRRRRVEKTLARKCSLH